MGKIIEWLGNLPQIIQIFLTLGTVILILGFLKPIADGIRYAKNAIVSGIKEAFTPLGFFVLVVLGIIFFFVRNFFGG